VHFLALDADLAVEWPDFVMIVLGAALIAGRDRVTSTAWVDIVSPPGKTKEEGPSAASAK
jgi:hypothetical protein